MLAHSLGTARVLTYPIDRRLGVEDLVLDSKRIESWETGLCGLVEEIFMGYDLNDIVSVLVIVQPQRGLFPSNLSGVFRRSCVRDTFSTDTIYKYLDFVSDILCIFLHGPD